MPARASTVSSANRRHRISPGRRRNGKRVPLALLLWVAACTNDPDSARALAERFLDAHYVQIDLAAAEKLASGVAGEKIAEERRLTAGQVIDDATRKPSVYYRLLEERPDGEARSRLVYQATFSMTGAPDFERRILLVLRREAPGWRVVNFEEFE